MTFKPTQRHTGIDFHDLAALCAELGLDIIKTENNAKNIGKTPFYALAEELQRHYCINVWPTPDHVDFGSERPDRPLMSGDES